MRRQKMSEEKFDPVKDHNNQDEIINEDETGEIGEDIEIIEINPDELPEDDLAQDVGDIGIDEAEMDDEDEEEDEEEDEDEPIQKIEKHKGSVFCIDVFENHFATGGEDDLGYIFAYDPSNKNKAAECELETEKFSDSVTQVRFNHDGKLVAMCDMSGRARVYNVSSKTLLWSHEIDSDVEQMSWHAQANVLFCSTADGYFYMFKIANSGESEMRIMYAGDNVGLSCFRLLADGKRAVCCYNSGTIRFWDLKNAQPIASSLVNCHEGEIICCELSHDGNLIATGGTDLKLRIINTNTTKLLATLDCSPVTSKKTTSTTSTTKTKTSSNGNGQNDQDNDDEEENSIESITFSHHLALVACATLSGHILVWDLNTYSVRCHFDNQLIGYSKLVWTKSNDEKIYAATLAGHLQVFDGRNLECMRIIRCHQRAEILDFTLSLAHSLVFTAFSDGLIKIFPTDS